MVRGKVCAIHLFTKWQRGYRQCSGDRSSRLHTKQCLNVLCTRTGGAVISGALRIITVSCWRREKTRCCGKGGGYGMGTRLIWVKCTKKTVYQQRHTQRTWSLEPGWRKNPKITFLFLEKINHYWVPHAFIDNIHLHHPHLISPCFMRPNENNDRIYGYSSAPQRNCCETNHASLGAIQVNRSTDVYVIRALTPDQRSYFRPKKYKFSHLRRF